MRVLVLAFLIVILPLRSWAGDLMALDMAAGQLSAMKEIAAHAHSAGASGHFEHEKHADHSTLPCPDHATPADASDAMNTGDQGHCNTCTACQVCHSVALTSVTAAPGVAELPQAMPVRETTVFASAEPAPGFKPPIA